MSKMCQPERKVSFFAQQQRRRVHNLKRFTPILTQVEPISIALAIVRQLISLAHVVTEHCSFQRPTMLVQHWFQSNILNFFGSYVGKVNDLG